MRPGIREGPRKNPDVHHPGQIARGNIVNNRTIILCASFFLLGAFFQIPGPVQSSAAGSAMKSHHLLNLDEVLSEAEFVEALRQINHAISDSGRPNAGYRLWKVSGDQTGDYEYLWEGVWPDKLTYDAIHESQAYQQAWEKALGPVYQRIDESQVYHRFVEIPVSGPGTSSAADTE